MAALEGGMSLDRVLDLTARASERTSAALILMGYLNPILRMGVDRFAKRAFEAGATGAIVPDVPLEESAGIRSLLKDGGLTFVDLVAPTSSRERIQGIAEAADGFVYLVSLTGVTGVRKTLSQGLGGFVDRVRQHTDLPLYVGFGVSGGSMAAEVVQHADGVIIGSALIKIIQAANDSREAVANVQKFLQEVKQAMHGNGSDQK
jgi:tryptophan synthase alpha chain